MKTNMTGKKKGGGGDKEKGNPGAKKRPGEKDTGMGLHQRSGKNKKSKGTHCRTRMKKGHRFWGAHDRTEVGGER